MNAVEQFRDAIIAAGLEPPEMIEPDGKLHRFASNGKARDLAGWYVLHGDGIPADAFGCWRSGTSETWRPDIERTLTPVEEAEHRRKVEAMRQEREAEETRRHAEARKKAAAIWQAAKPAPDDHPYLVRKGVKAHGLRVHKGALVVPMRDGEELHTLQFIAEDGTKRFLNGCRVAGCYFIVGAVNGATALCVCEGFATGATIHEATAHLVIVAFSSGYLIAVAKAMRAKFPGFRLILCADDDHRTQGNPGLSAAIEAALAVGGLLAVPDFGARRPEGASDFNDLALHRGLEAVKEAIVNAKPGHTKKLDKEAVEKLAKLSPFDYDRAREAEAARLKVRVSSLDVEVRKARGETADHGQGQAFAIESPEPWPGPVNAVELLDDIAAAFRRYVILPAHADAALALWTMHTYSYDRGRCTPILALTSPQKRCGKTTLMSVLLSLANKPLAASNISPSCVFRSIDRWQPTLLIDEADSFIKDNEELCGIINSGHTRELAFVIRNVGDEHEPRRFSTWCPKALALIGKLPPTLHDRAIEISLVRKTAGESVHRLKELDGADIRRKCICWVSDNTDGLRLADPVVPLELHDRAADNWRPLLAIADAAGGEWPDLARAAAAALTDSDDDTESYAVMLLADIRDLFTKCKTDKLFSEDVVTHLRTLEDRTWSQWARSQKPITKNQVARLLRTFKIRPGDVHVGDEHSKGYQLEMFKDAFLRYLPPLQVVRPCGFKQDAAFSGFQTVRTENGRTDRNPPKPAPHNDPHGRTDQKASTGETEA